MFLHTFHPDPILISFGPINIYWYGIFIVLGILSAVAIALKLSEYYEIKKETIIDLAFYLIIFGIIGARVYDVFLEAPYYLKNPLDVFKIWQGGLAIHGAIIAGAAVIYLFAKKRKLNFWLLASLITPGLALAQAIGRWGNYFNQELFGKPTDLPLGIPIDLINRPLSYISTEYFHPTFLYESIGNLIIFIILISLHYLIIKRKAESCMLRVIRYELSVMSYAILYSILRFSTEFIRIDRTPELFHLRFPQIASIFIVISCFILLLPRFKNNVNIN